MPLRWCWSVLLIACCCVHPGLLRLPQGTFTPLAPELSMLSSENVTDAEGRFTVTPATLGTYSWRASGCVDTVTQLPLSYDWELTAPAYARMVVTDLALLTGPASRNLGASEQGSPEAFERVYRAFGIDAQQLKVCLSWRATFAVCQ